MYVQLSMSIHIFTHHSQVMKKSIFSGTGIKTKQWKNSTLKHFEWGSAPNVELIHNPTVSFLSQHRVRKNSRRFKPCTGPLPWPLRLHKGFKTLDWSAWDLFGIAARRVYIYLALLHGVAEERVQQQVLQIGIPVESLFDFSQEDAVGQGLRKWERSLVIFTAQRRNGITSVATLLIAE